MLERKRLSLKHLFRVVWLFCRRSEEQRRHITMILEAFEKQDLL
jgi:hypothetical protein